MDDLTYNSNDYAPYGNKLMDVNDAIAANANEGGFKEDDGVGGDDYAYDENGNMTKGLNKGVAAIIYNYLNLPSQVSKSGTDYIVYSYDASGKKLAQQVYGTEAKTTDYIGELVFENNALQFVTHIEGRVVMAGGTDYQYFLKDHLGNVRVTFSGQTTSEEFKATLEDESLDYEFYAFRNYPSPANRSSLGMYNHTNEPGSTYSQLLTGAPNYQVGLAKSFEVNSGDVFDLEVFAKYEASGSTATNIGGLLTSLLSVFNLPSVGGTGLESQAARNAFTDLYDAGVVIGDERPYEDPGAPRAYLNYVLFNESFQLVDFGYDQIDESADHGPHDRLTLHVNVQQKGYLYIFLSNENQEVQNVYFDDLKIMRYTDIQQVEDYYPFGLAFNSFARENSIAQHFKYNGVENEDELDLNINTTFFRMHDPALGRWWQIDPKAREDMTPYSAMGNNPILYSDPMGDTTRIYSTSGKLLTTVNDSHENQSHFVDKKSYAKIAMSRGEKEGDDEYASRLRDGSIAFIGSNTVKDMQSIVKESGDIDKEIGFVGRISDSKEIRLEKLPVTASNKFNTIEGTQSQLDNNYTDEQQGKLFLYGHVHHKGLLRLQSNADLYEPSKGGDVHHRLRDRSGATRPSPLMVATPSGYNLYPSIGFGGERHFIADESREKYSFFKKGKR